MSLIHKNEKNATSVEYRLSYDAVHLNCLAD